MIYTNHETKLNYSTILRILDENRPLITNSSLHFYKRLFNTILKIICVLPSGRSLAPIPSTPFFPQLFSSSSSSRTFHKIIYHSSSWPASRPLPQHSSLQHIPQQSISSKHISYPVLLSLVYSSYET